MQIKINKLIFTGTHGATEKEKHTPQRFEINIVITPWGDDVKGILLEETVDYRRSKKIVQKVIEGEFCELIETLAHKMALEIIEDKKIREVEVAVRKLDIWDNGAPEVVVKKDNFYFSNLLDFDVDDVIHQLIKEGGVSFPIIPEERRVVLLKEGEKYEYAKQPEFVGKHKVREQLSSFAKFPEESLYRRLQEDFTSLLNYKLQAASVKPFLNSPVIFNEPVLQKYDAGSIGITPHVDHAANINLICVFLMKGYGSFYLCDDREKTNSRFLEAAPGHVMILRAPGFLGSNFRPFHYLENILEDRLTFGLRFNTKI